MHEFALAFLLSYLWHGLGVTVGYHRLLAHRSFRCPKLVEYFFVSGGYFAMHGAPAWWAAVHRVHHKFTDVEHDPHSPRDGYLHSAFTWLFRQDLKFTDVNIHASDLMKDPLYRFLDKGDDALQWSLNFAFRAGLFYFFGWQVCLANTIAQVICLTVPLLLNFFCHIPSLGYRNYETQDDSVNVWWIALLANGEGWHNNHHVFPGSARSGLKKWELDLSWLVISTLQKVGLANHVNDALARERSVTSQVRSVTLTERPSNEPAGAKQLVAAGKSDKV